MLTNRVTRRIDLPHEPGQWVEARMPSMMIMAQARTAARLAGVDDFDAFTYANHLLRACVTGWSYEAEVTAENIDEIDDTTAALVIGEITGTVEPGEQKND